mmetsp:Transcript_17111/g.29771  ORF Transcript_17111/g.29771 Transcript_17111/m.29771 type:complete len:224 (-) Transcript_17111:278-949(-)
MFLVRIPFFLENFSIYWKKDSRDRRVWPFLFYKSNDFRQVVYLPITTDSMPLHIWFHSCVQRHIFQRFPILSFHRFHEIVVDSLQVGMYPQCPLLHQNVGRIGRPPWSNVGTFPCGISHEPTQYQMMGTPVGRTTSLDAFWDASPVHERPFAVRIFRWTSPSRFKLIVNGGVGIHETRKLGVMGVPVWHIPQFFKWHLFVGSIRIFHAYRLNHELSMARSNRF